MANVQAAKEFAKKWKDKGNEKQDTQKFWLELMSEVFEDKNVYDDVWFEDPNNDGTSQKYKDVVIFRKTNHAVLIEQKSIGTKIEMKEIQSDGSSLTPFEQAKRYDNNSGSDDKARWIIVCDFARFWVYDMTKTGKELYVPIVQIHLSELPKKLDSLRMLSPVDYEKKPIVSKEVAVSKEAGALVGVMYDALRKRYDDPDSEETAKNLNKLCVRIVFCLYAEDAGLFNKNNRKIFHDYLAQFDTKGMRKGLRELFRVLNQRENERDKYLADDDPLLASFPYVNGGLFEGDVEIPPFDDEICEILLVKESMGFDWSVISPTIFGAVFESTLNPETRRQGGMHYTSIENIHKVIDPLFLDELTAELNEILKGRQVNVREKNLLAFQKKIAGLKFLDPAAGSGNFLTESYLCLRNLENKIIAAVQEERKIGLGFEGETDWIKVSIQQFYGIEINDFAVAVAKTALWIAEAQMYEKTQEILSSNKEFLPLHEYDNIKEGNALRMDWGDVVPATELNYIMGNPPFVGFRWQNDEQKCDLDRALDSRFKHGKLDYVTGWFIKTCDFIQKTNIRAALVSTNSITQGEHVAVFWNYAIKELNVHIDFAYKTFEWKSEASDQASVHVVIIGFSQSYYGEKVLFDGAVRSTPDFISPYLTELPPIVVTKQSKPISGVKPLVPGCQESGNGNLLFTPEEKDELIKKEPQSKDYFRQFMMGKEFLNGIDRYCLWIPDVSLMELKRNHPLVMERVLKVAEFRKKSTNEQIKAKAAIPNRFDQYRPPTKKYIAFARVSSQRREYLPIGYLTDQTIPGDKLFTIPDGDLYMFGILSSIIHAAWLRVTGGRLKSDYSYSTAMVYNTFVWPTVTVTQRRKIEVTAEAILQERNRYNQYTLAEMYDPNTMPVELRKAHEANDKAVMEAYGFKKGMSESEIVAELMKMYQKLAEQ